MAASRIFPTQEWRSLGGEEEFVGINWLDVASSLADPTGARPNQPVTASDILAALRTAEKAEDFDFGDDVDEGYNGDDYDEDEGEDLDGEEEIFAAALARDHRTAKRALPEALKKHQFKKKGEEATEEDEAEDEGRPLASKTVRAKEASARSRTAPRTASARQHKIVFTDRSQISHEALEAARRSGDTVMVRAIEAGRRMDIQNLVADVLEMSTEEAIDADNRERRASLRDNTVRVAEQAVKPAKPAGARSGKSATAGKKPVATAKPAAPTFQAASQMSAGARSAFASKCVELGFPEDYLTRVMGSPAQGARLSSAAEEIKTVMATEMPDSTKRVAVASMIREANLSEAETNQLVNYWANTLGYDRAYVESWFRKKF